MRTRGFSPAVFGKQNLIMMTLDPIMQIQLAKKEELLKVKAEQEELNEVEGQAIQLQGARRPSQDARPGSSKKTSAGVVIRDEPEKKKLWKMILSPTSEDEDAEDRQPIGKSLKH